MNIFDRYLGSAWALERVKERVGIAETDHTKDETLIEMLQISGGTHPAYAGKIIHRPYYVAAMQLQQDVNRQFLKKAGDAEFNDLSNTIASLMGLQRAVDLTFNTIVPPGFEAIPLDGTGNLSQAGKNRRAQTPSYVPVRTMF